MRLSCGWRGLLLFWIGVLSLGGIGAGTLQVLGPADRPEAAVKPGDPGQIQLASLVPVISSAAAVVPAPAAEAQDASVEAARTEDAGSSPPVSPIPAASAAVTPAVEVPAKPQQVSAPPAAEARLEPTALVATETSANAPTQPTGLQPPATETTAPAAIPPTGLQALATEEPVGLQAPATETIALAAIPPTDFQASAAEPAVAAFSAADGIRREVPASRKVVLLRLARDTKPCPTTHCLRWHVVQRHAKSPRGATLDFARLRLAPGLREAAEGGQIELFIDAIEQHRTVNGRENVIFVATGLAGVTPHDKSP